MFIRFILPVMVAFFVSACSSGPVRDIGLDKLSPRKAERSLSSGLASYENGQYSDAARQLQGALNSGLAFNRDRVTAYKYLAFVYCVTDRRKQCKGAFRKALEIDSDLELSAAEAGHPLWGPVFREAKAEQNKQKD